MRLLVTGASGYIGRACLRHLRGPGMELHGVTARSHVEDHALTLHHVDLLDHRQTARLVREVRPTHLLHLAWKATPGVYWTSPENERWLLASERLLHEFAAAGGKRAVFAGSCAEYDWSAGVCDELSTPLKPTSIYGQSKAAMWRHVETAITAGLSAAWGRIFWSFGPHEPATRLVPSIILSLLAGRRAQCSSGQQVRDFMHVDDIGAGLAALLRSGVTGAVNVAAGEGIAVRHLAERIARQIGRPDAIDFGADTGREAPRVVANVTRLRHEVGFTPRLSLDERLAQTIAWWRESAAARA